MDTSKIITGVVSARGYTVTAPIVKEDYGLYLKIEGVELPSTYQVDFSNSENNGTSVTMIGNSDGVLIPSQFIKSGKDVFAFLYHVGADYGRTVYKFRIPNKVRPDRTNEEPTPEEQSVIDQCISALNEAVAQTAQDVESADQSAQSASDDADRAERAKTSSETAQGKAEEAQESAERAKDDAETSERNASESERKAKGYADTASEKADSIIGLTATATTLPDGSSATASYNAETGVMSFGIPKGKDGTDGDDGYSPTASVIKSGKVATITITDKNGTTSAQVEDGEDGTDGIDGISPSVSVTDITGGHRVVITDKDGAKSFDVEDGATGATPNFTIGTVETLEPTESATATITGTPENPVLNLGIPQGEQGEVTLADLNTALMDKADIITDTASGSIASFTDGADDLPLKSLIVDINPVQDLHGQDAPYPAGAYNLIPYPYYSSAGTYDGITYIINSDGTVKASGTTTGGTNFFIARYFSLKAGTYTLSCKMKSTGMGLLMRDVNGARYLATLNATSSTALRSSTFTIETDVTNINIYLNCGYADTVVDVDGWFQLETGDTASGVYHPYSNICPISGWTEVQVEQSGVNLFDGNSFVSGRYDNADFSISSASDTRSAKIYLKAGSYTLSANGTSSINRRILNGAMSSATRNLPISFTLSADGWFGFSTTDLTSDFKLELGSTATPYSPYAGRSITIQLGQTVYGGKLDVLTGELVIDRAMVDLGTLTWSYQASPDGIKLPRFASASIANAINKDIDVQGGLVGETACSALVLSKTVVVSRTVDHAYCALTATGLLYVVDTDYSDVASFTSGMSGVQLLYPLATPLEIQLTPNQVNSLLGVNNLWADSGDTEVEYRADTKAYIAKKIAEALASLT